MNTFLNLYLIAVFENVAKSDVILCCIVDIIIIIVYYAKRHHRTLKYTWSRYL